MFTRRFFWRLFPLMLLVALAALAAIGFIAGRTTRDTFLASIERDLRVRAVMLAPLAKEGLNSSVAETPDALCKRLGAATGTRFTVILPNGKVVGDTAEDPRSMPSHADRPEIRRALEQQVGTATRFSTTVELPMMYVAVTIEDGDRTLGVARAAVPIDFIDRELDSFYRKLMVGGLAVAGFAAMLSFVLARRLSRPLEEIQKGARTILEGTAAEPLAVVDSTELGALAEAVNRMALELDDRLRAALRQNRELEAILATMTDGVLVTDLGAGLVRVNHAARTLLGLDDGLELPPGFRSLPPGALQSLIERILSSSAPAEEELSLGADGARPVQVRGMPLRDSFDHTIGALVVLTDKTRVRQLETLRRDFAAHASHELKTPITAIRGFADTLLGGAIEEPQPARRFVGFIAEQTHRLERLVDGLLDLAKIERQTEHRDLERAWHHLGPLLDSAIRSLEGRARERNNVVTVECAPDLAARVNAPLVERAVANLVDNAIRYGPAGATIAVRAREDAEAVRIQVTDEGEAIPTRELERLFERFYRSPRAREHHPEGSGLGLAIVKHVAEAHRGAVRAASAPNAGTTFELSLSKY